MRKERRSPESRLHLDDIVRLAEDVILRDGHHIPILLVEGTTDLMVMQLPGLPDEPELRQAMLFEVGKLVTSTASVGRLRQVFMITEAWLSIEQEGKPVLKRPSEDPHRKEVLLVAAMYPATGKQALELREMIRAANGELMDLRILRPPGHATEAVSPLLEAFVAGYETQHRSALR